MNEYMKTIWINGFASAPHRIFKDYGVNGHAVHETMNELSALMYQQLDINNAAQAEPVKLAKKLGMGLLESRPSAAQKVEFEESLEAVVGVIEAA